MEVTLAELAQRIGGELYGTKGIEVRIDGVGAVATASESHVTFVTKEKHATTLRASRAAAAIVTEPVAGFDRPQLIVRDVDRALIETLRLFAPEVKGPAPGVDPSAHVGRNVRMGADVSVGPGAVLADGVQIGPRTVVGSGCVIGENTRIGADCRLDSGVVIYYNCVLGDYVTVQANATIGAVGFGYVQVNGTAELIPHAGGVVIEDAVHIGANCCIDRAKFGNTIIGAGTKIDNLVQIAHNVVIGKCCLIAAQVGIAGSSKLGDGVVLAGQVGLADNIEVGAGTMVGAQSGVMNSVGPGKKLAWSPALEVGEAGRVVAQVLRLPKLAQRLKHLTKRVDKLEAAEDD